MREQEKAKCRDCELPFEECWCRAWDKLHGIRPAASPEPQPAPEQEVPDWLRRVAPRDDYPPAAPASPRPQGEPDCPHCKSNAKVSLLWVCERCGDRWSPEPAPPEPRGRCIYPGCEDTAKAKYPVCYTHRNKPHWDAEEQPDVESAARQAALDELHTLILEAEEELGGHASVANLRRAWHSRLRAALAERPRQGGSE